MQSELSQHPDGVDRYISMHITLSAPTVVCSDVPSESDMTASLLCQTVVA